MKQNISLFIVSIAFDTAEMRRMNRALDKNSKIIFLFNNIDPFICRRRAAYVHLCMDLRQSLL